MQICILTLKEYTFLAEITSLLTNINKTKPGFDMCSASTSPVNASKSQSAVVGSVSAPAVKENRRSICQYAYCEFIDAICINMIETLY